VDGGARPPGRVSLVNLIVSRTLTSIPVLVMVALITFFLLRLIPGDPAAAIAGTDATPDQIAAIREMLNLDRPLLDQLLAWGSSILRGDFGVSITQSRPVLDVILERLPVTISLGLYSLIIAIPLGILFGVIAALKRGTTVDASVTTVALLGLSLPNFWVGLMGVLVFSVHLKWLPAMGYVSPENGIWPWIRSMTLPAAVIGVAQIGLLARITRSTILDILRLDYIRTARAKGMSEARVVVRHALRNALIPIVTVIGAMFGLLIGGAVVTEAVFAIPGIGRLVIQSIVSRDYPVVQGILLLTAFSFVLINLLVDIIYTYLDPRVSYD